MRVVVERPIKLGVPSTDPTVRKATFIEYPVGKVLDLPDEQVAELRGSVTPLRVVHDPDFGPIVIRDPLATETAPKAGLPRADHTFERVIQARR